MKRQILAHSMRSDTDFTTRLTLADQLVYAATRDRLAKTVRLLILKLAHYRLRFGELPLMNFERHPRTQTMDQETGQLVARGMENLAGVMGCLTAQNQRTNMSPWLKRFIATTQSQGRSSTMFMATSGSSHTADAMAYPLSWGPCLIDRHLGSAHTQNHEHH